MSRPHATPPPLGPDTPLPAPKPAHTTLANGLGVVAVHAPGVPLVEIRLRIPLTAPLPPMALDILGHLVTSDVAAAAGTNLTFDHNTTAFTLDVTTPASALPRTLSTLAQLVTTPCHETARRRAAAERQRARAPRRRSSAPDPARKALLAHCYGPTAFPTPPDPAAPIPSTPDELCALHRRVLRPKGGFLLLAGDLDPDAVLADLPLALTHWSAPSAPFPPQIAPRPTGRGIVHVERADAVQSQILLAAPALDPADPGFYTLSLACCVIGGSFSARLPVHLRDRLGLTYRVGTSIECHRNARFILVTADTATETTERTLRELRHQLGRGCQENPPSTEEIVAAREYVLGATAVSAASQLGLVELLTHALVNGFSPDWLETYPCALRAVTPEDIRRALREFFDPALFSGVVVGDKKAWARIGNSAL